MSFRIPAAVLVVLGALVVIPWSASSSAATSQRWRNVTYDGVRLSVPASWPVIRFASHPSACPRLDVHAVYLGTPAPDPICPAGLVGKTEAVIVSPTHHSKVARRSGPAAQSRTQATTRTGAQARVVTARRAMTSHDSAVGRTITDVVPRSGVQVAISYGTDRSLALAIQSSVKLTARHPATAAVELSARTELLEHREFTSSDQTTRSSGHSPHHSARHTPARPQTSGPFIGSGFDSCAAPSADAMTKWLSSGFRSVGIYIGGANEACAQANLTPAWLTGIAAQGWHYFSIYPGLQSSCVQASGDATIVTSQAAQEGKAAASDAATQAASLGIPQGAPLIYDMEAYGPSCDSQVTTFLSAWDKQVQARGYTSGVYESFTNVGALVSAAASITEPQVIFYADWDGQATTNSSYMPTSMWTSHQRLHQFQGSHLATFGGVSIDIDSDRLDVNLAGAPVAPAPAPAAKSALRIALGLNTNGTAEWFARSATNTLTHSWQAPVGSLTWSAMHPVGRSPSGFVSNPSVTPLADGALAIFGRTKKGTIAHAWQQAGFPNDWEWGKALPTPPRPAKAGTDPASLLLPSGQVEVFQTAGNGSIDAISQRQPNGNATWTAWQSLGGHCASSPVAITDDDSLVAVYCITTAGKASTISWNGSAWGPWATLGGSPSNLTGVPAVVLNGAGQTELFAANATGGLADAWQTGSGGTWIWAPPLATKAVGGPITVSPSAATWPAGQVIVYARQSSGRLESIRQTGITGSSPWGTWTAIPGIPGGKAISSPVGWLNSIGAASVAVIGQNRGLSVSSNTGTGWSTWTQAGTGF